MKDKADGVNFVEVLQIEQTAYQKKKTQAQKVAEKAAKKKAEAEAKAALERDKTTVECAIEAAKTRFAKKNVHFFGDNFYRVINEVGEISKLPWHIYVPFEGGEPGPLTEKWLYKKRWILKRNKKGYYIIPDTCSRWPKRLKFFFKMVNDLLWGDFSDFIYEYIKK